MSTKTSLESMFLNDLTYMDYLDRLSVIALSRFKWYGLPESCNARFLEKTLFENGKAIFVYDKTLGYLNLRVNPSSSLNFYEEGTKYQAFSVGYDNMFDKDECVIIRNNILEKPTLLSLQLFCARLAKLERTIDVNIDGQKTPNIILCDEKELLSVKNFMKKVDDFESRIYTTKGFNIDMIKVLNTQSPYVADKLMIAKRDIWNEALTFLGVNNANTDKRERLVTDEVNSNNELIENMANTMLESRKKACEEINNMFGLSVSVELVGKESVESGTIYNGIEDDNRE